jgi:ATP-dependent RNA helicase SUPV3L1/SUV3
LVEGVGIIPRQQVADVMKSFDKDLRTTARAAGTHFGALDIYHYAMAKPRASFWRTVLSSVWYGHALPQMPDESAVHLTDFPFVSEDMARLAGYRRVGNEYLRVDLAERLVKQAHEKRGEAHDFAVDLSYATSLGLSEAGLIALLEEAGFRRIDAPEEMALKPVAEEETVPASAEPVAEPVGDSAPDSQPAVEPDPVAAIDENTATDAPAVVGEPAEANQPDETSTEPAAPEPAAPEPEIRVGDKGEFKVVGTSFFYDGPKLWFSWGRGLGLRGGGRGPDRDNAKGAPRRADDNDANRNNRRKKGGQAGQFKGQKSGGDHQNRSRDSSPPPTKAYTEKPRAQSALAEALGAQLAAARAKQKD